MKNLLVILLGLISLFFASASHIAFADDLQDVLSSYKAGEYNNAHKLLSPLAEEGDALAQLFFGVMHEQGQGVPQDYREAAKWYQLSADQGDAKAQLNLGVMYSSGQGVPQDYASAHMWWNICGSGGDKDCVKNRNIVEKEMSPSQIEKAQDMARNWKLYVVKRICAKS